MTGETTGSNSPGPGEGSPGAGGVGTGDTGQQAGTQDTVSQATFNQLKTQRDGLKSENEVLKSRPNVTEADVAELERLRTEDAQRNTDTLAAKGEFETLKNQLTESHSNELSAKDTVITNLRSSLSTELVDGKILAAATDKAHDPAKVVKLLRSNITLDFKKDGGYAIAIIDDSGNKVYNDNGDPISLADYVVRYLKDNPDLQPSKAVSGSGGNAGAENQSGKVGGQVVGTGDKAVRVPTMKEQANMTDLEEIKATNAALRKAGIGIG